MRLEPTCITRKEAARRLGITVPALRSLTRTGQLLLVKVRGRWLVPVSELAYAGGA